MTKLLTTLVLILSLGGGYFYLNQKNKPQDLCQAQSLRTQQTVVSSKDKSRLKLFMGYSYDRKVRRFLPHVKKIKTTSYYHQQKLKPKYTSLTTEFKSKKAAKKAYRYLSWKWKKKKKKKKNQYDVVLKDKTVTWFSNSHYQPQCFHKVMKSTKTKLGIVEKKKSKKVTKKKRLKKSKRTIASVKRKSKKRNSRSR